jgi:hypothetical protein
MENTYQTFFRFKFSLNQLFQRVFSPQFCSRQNWKLMPVLLLGNTFLLLCNENILFNRVKNIVFVLSSQGYLIKEIENIVPVFP